MGQRRKRPGPPLPSEEDLRRMYEIELRTVIEIGKITKCGRRRIRAALDLYGIEARHTGPRSPEHHGSWNGGRVVDKSGYILVKCDDHPDANHQGYVREHRLVMEDVLGRRLLPTEVVDHIDGNKSNNDPSNLRVFESNAEHLRVTLKGKCPKWTPEGAKRIEEGVQRALNARRKKTQSALPPIFQTQKEVGDEALSEATGHLKAEQEPDRQSPSQTGDTLA